MQGDIFRHAFHINIADKLLIYKIIIFHLPAEIIKVIPSLVVNSLE